MDGEIDIYTIGGLDWYEPDYDPELDDEGDKSWDGYLEIDEDEIDINEM